MTILLSNGSPSSTQPAAETDLSRAAIPAGGNKGWLWSGSVKGKAAKIA